jgi:hypothetical protein
MKKILLFVLIFVLANQFAYSWVKGGVGDVYYIHNPENDKDLVITTVIESQPMVFYLDLVNWKTTKLPITTEAIAAISEKNSMLITRESSFVLYNYKTGEKILSFDKTGETAYTICRIDSSGKYFYTWNGGTLTLKTYDIYAKNLIDTFTYDINPVNIIQSLLLPRKDALCMINKSGEVKFYSLSGDHSSNLADMTLPTGKKVTVWDNNNYFTYVTGANSICIQKIDPNAEPINITLDHKYDNISFTLGMKYCYYDYGSQDAVYDIENKKDRPIITIPYGGFKAFFRDSTLGKSLIGYVINYPTSSIPIIKADVNMLLLYDVENQKIRSTVPEAFAGSVDNMIINTDGSMVYANSQGGVTLYYKFLPLGGLVRNQDSTFLRYLHPIGKSFVFTDDSKYMVSADSNSIYFTNTNTDLIDKTVANTNVSQRKVLFSSDNSQIYNIYSTGIDVYDYPAMNLIKSVKYENNDTLDILDAKNFNNVTTILTNDKICWYAKDADVLTYSSIPRISTKLKAIELSPKGDYALLYTRYAKEGSQDTFLVMNVYSKEIKYRFMHRTWAAPFEVHFFGTHKRLAYSYDNGNSPLFYSFLSGINLETGVEKELVGMYRAFMNPTENGYFSAREPYYYYTGLPSELIVGVKDNQPMESSFDISPNPAGDFIAVTMKPSEGFELSEGSEIHIYNTLGEKVMTELIHPMTASHRRNIENLPKGMYFMKIGGEIAKFVKM